MSINWAITGSDNGLLPDANKPLPGPMLTELKWGLVPFTWGQLTRKCSTYLCFIRVWKLIIQNCSHICHKQLSWYKEIKNKSRTYTMVYAKCGFSTATVYSISLAISWCHLPPLLFMSAVVHPWLHRHPLTGLPHIPWAVRPWTISGLIKSANILQITFTGALSVVKISVQWLTFQWGLFLKVNFTRSVSSFLCKGHICLG